MPFIDRSQDEQGRLFLRYFLADDTLNERGWRLSPESLEAFAKSFINKPFTVMKDVNESLFKDYHPFALKESATVQEDIDFAEKYAIGHIVDVAPTPAERLGAGATTGFEAIVEIEDPFAKEELSKPDTKLIPSEVSPGIVRLAGSKTNVEEFWGLHLAAVPQGAYGPRAREVARCAGEHRACVHELLAASNYEWAKLPNTFGFHQATYKGRTGGCPVGALETLAASSSHVTENQSSTNNMSYSTGTGSAINSNVSKAPGPQTYGTNTFSTPTGTTIATQQYNKPQVQQQPAQAQGQQQPVKKAVLKLKNPQRFLNISKADHHKSPEELAKEEEEKKKQGQGQEGQQQPQEQEQAQTPLQSPDNKVLSDFENTKKEMEIMKRKWDLQFVIPHEAFLDKNGNFMKKEYEKEIDKVAHNAMPVEMVEEYYRNKLLARKYTEAQEQLVTVSEKQQQKKNSGRLGASSIAIPSSSSQDNEELEKISKLLRLNIGGSY